MAYVINPDGTIKLLKVEFDHSGNIRPKKIIDGINPSFTNTSSQKPKKKKELRASTLMPPSYEKKENASTSEELDNQKSSNIAAPTTAPHSEASAQKYKPVLKYAPKTPEKKKIFQTKEAINEYFAQRKELRQIVHQEILEYVTKHLNSELSAYFINCFNEHNDHCRKMGWVSKEPERKPKKKRKEAAFTPVGKSSNGKFGSSRHPVYGYARDRYGRVQERDSLNEERKNEFGQSQSLQRRYDYSSYDSENDHDSYYDSNSYD